MIVDTATVDTTTVSTMSNHTASNSDVLQVAHKSLMRQGVDVVEFLNLLMLFRKFFFDNISDAIDADLIECYSLDNSTWFFHINLCEFVSAEECADLNDKWQDVMIDWMYADKLTRRRVLDHVNVCFNYS